MDVELIINGEEKTASIPPETTLLLFCISKKAIVLKETF